MRLGTVSRRATIRRRDLLQLGATAAAALVSRRASGQPAPITRVAIVIGVDAPSSLPKLNAAASGAKDVGNWLRAQGFTVKALTDDVYPVTGTAIFQAVAWAVELSTVEQLVIYFAGHGFVVGYSEFWLLSGAPHNPNEAVSLTESRDLARRCGIPNVVFISDACRSTTASLGAQSVRGQIIFPGDVNNRNVKADIDQFLATKLGDGAYEVQDAMKQYNGVYTSLFLGAYKQPCSYLVDQIGGRQVVLNKKLGPYLVTSGRKKAAAMAVSQEPDSIIESSEAYVGVAQTPLSQCPEPQVGVSFNVLIGRELDRFGFVQTNVDAKVSFDNGLGPGLTELADKVGFSRNRALILSGVGSTKFDYQTGINVFGASVREVVGFNIKAEIIQRPEQVGQPTRIQVFPVTRRGVVLLTFSSGSGTVITTLEGLAANVVVDQDSVISVHYVPAGSTSDDQAHALLYATIATAAKFGAFRLDGPLETRQKNALQLTKMLRDNKPFDPSLGLYAAYALADAGLTEQIHALQTYMAFEKLSLFDVDLLAGSLSPGRTIMTPVFPMLSQGWTWLRVKNVHLSERLAEANEHLLPGLWTTFDLEGMKIVKSTAQQAPG